MAVGCTDWCLWEEWSWEGRRPPLHSWVQQSFPWWNPICCLGLIYVIPLVFGLPFKSNYLVLLLVPPLQVAEQTVQALHSPTSQSTELDLKQNLWPCQPTLWTACSVAISLVSEMEICTSLTTVQSISNLFPARERRGASIGLFDVISIIHYRTDR